MEALRSMAGRRKGDLATSSMTGRSFVKDKYDRLEYLMQSEYSVRNSSRKSIESSASKPPEISKTNNSP